MDILKEIHRNVKALPAETASGVLAAVRHITQAERHFDRAREEQTPELLNDVIYRTNQAFEGMLKEAYQALLQRNPATVSTYGIEQALEEEQVLAPRVRELFSNYRKEWRNESTHDHNLTFSDQEALLAIVSVSAFSAVLVDQMVGVATEEEEHEATLEARTELEGHLDSYDSLEFRDQILSLVDLFIEERTRQGEDTAGSPREVELIGRLAGFVSAMDPDIKIQEHSSGDNTQPDLVLRKASRSAVVDVIQGFRTMHLTKLAKDQVGRHMEAFPGSIGVILFLPALGEHKFYRDEVPGRNGKEIDVYSPTTWATEY